MDTRARADTLRGMNAPLRCSDHALAAAGESVQWEGEIYDGVRSTYGSTPTAFLRATADELFLSGHRGEFHLPRAQVWKIARGEFYPWLFCAVQIHHGIAAYPNELQFKPAHATPHDVLARLHALGYPAG